MPQEMSAETLKSTLTQRHRLEVEPERKINRTYYDSFDWRLLHAGGALEAETVPEGIRINWQDLERGTRLGSALLKDPPRFPTDFPAGDLRERLMAILEMRALLPMAGVESRVQTLRLLDEEEKTVLRVRLETNNCLSSEGGIKGPLTGRIRLLSVKGYAEPYASVHRLLKYELGLAPASEDLMVEAARSLGLKPGDYSSKLNFSFHPLMRSDSVAKQIQLHLLDTLEANIDGTKQDLDSEFLHDLRVATRRSRSALGQIKGVFSEADVERFKEKLGWIGGITGPTRDMDVYLLAFDEYRDSLPESVRSDLDPLREYLLAHHRSEQTKLAAQLDSPRFQTIVREWRLFLEAPVPLQSEASNAWRPVGELANERIYKIYKRVLREGLAIGPGTPAEAYHELRKNCKKLRYLMEYFESLYPKRQIRRLIKALKVLLDNLGDFQDLQVQADKLRQFGREMLEEGTAPADTLLAMGMLVDGLFRRQQKAGEAFAQRFADFAEPEIRQASKKLFAEPRKEVL